MLLLMGVYSFKLKLIFLSQGQFECIYCYNIIVLLSLTFAKFMFSFTAYLV